MGLRWGMEGHHKEGSHQHPLVSRVMLPEAKTNYSWHRRAAMATAKVRTKSKPGISQ